MRPGTKTLGYLRRMISSGKWTWIPPAQQVADTLGVSVPTVRKAIKILEHGSSIENNGGLGYSVVPRKFSQLYKANKQLFYLSLISKNLKIAEMLDNGGKILGNFVFLKEDSMLKVANLTTGDLVETTESELERMLNHPVTVDAMLSLKGRKLTKAKALYMKQRRMTQIPQLVLGHRKELGI